MSSAEHLSELKSLRSQVADLARELAERDQSMRAHSHHLEETMQELREQSHFLPAIIEGTAAETGGEFFASLVTHLTSTLHVQYAVIGEVCEGRLKKIRTLAVSAGGTLVDNFEYELAHTPCATALTQTFACFDRDVQAAFPQFQRLVDLGVESYCGVPLRTKGGTVMGLLVVMDTKPLQHGDYLQSLLGVLAPRVVVEFERRRAEQERAQALADLHNVMETVPDVMFTLDTQGNLVKWNRRLGDVTGYSPEELLNKPALAFVPLEEQPRTAAAIQRAFTEGYAELDGHLLTKDHRTIPYHWTGALLKNAHGEPIGITGVGRDVSEKKQAEEELTQQRRHLVDAQALAHLGSWSWDIDKGEIQWSDELFRIFGHEPASIHVTYDTFLAALLPDDHDRVLAAINDALVGKMSYDIEYRIVRPNGEVRFIHARSDVYRDATGDPLSMAGTVLDITERKRIEDALRASEERWHLAVRGSNDGIWDWNIQTGDIFFSSRWKAMRGFEDHEVKNHVDEWRSRIHPDDHDRVLQSIDAYLAKLRPDFCEEYRVQRKEGSYIWVLDRGVALWADDGTPLRMVGSESDITEHRQALLRLAEQESLLRSILDAEPECVKRVAENGTLLQMNEAGLCFIETDSFAQVAGRSVYDLVAPEFLEPYRSMHEAVIRGASQQLEFQIVGLKGTRRWMETHAVPLQNPIDHRMEHLAVTRDISERKRAEEALRESEERFALAVEGSTDILWDGHRLPGEPWYAPQTPIWWSPRVRKLLGLEESESFETLEQWAARLHPDDKDRVFGQLAAHIEHRVPYDAEYRLRNNRGDYLWIRGRGQASWDEQGEIRRMSGSCQDITERKRADEAVLESRQQLQAVVEGTSDAVYVKDVMGRYLLFNSAAGRFVGKNAAEVVGRDDTFIFSHDDAQVVMEGDRAVMAGGQTLSYEERLTTADGERRTFHSTKGPLLNADGQVAGLFGVARDITERNQAEEAIREAELRYRTIFEQAGVGVAQIDSHTGRFVQANRRYCEIVGLTEAEMLATALGVITHPDDLQGDLENMTRLLRGEIRSFTMEKRYVRPDGGIVWVNLNVAPLWGPGEQAIHHIAIVEDITERKRTEEALRKSEERYARATAVGKVGVWELDVVTGTYHGDPNLKALFGYVGDELSTDPYVWLDLVHPDDQAIALDHWQRIVKGETDNYNYELRMLKKDGTVIWTDIRGHAIRDHEGQVTHLFGATVDISERKQAQDALAQSERQLRTVLDALPVGVWFTDQSGKPLLANPTAKQIWSNIKQIGLQTLNNPSGWWETIGPTNEPHRWALNHALTTGAASLNETFDLECLDGTKKTIRNSTVPVQDEAGNILGAIVLNEDITSLREAREAVRLTKFSVDHAVEGFIWIGSDARILNVNEAACRMLEYTYDELMTMTLHDIDPNFPLELWSAHWEELKQKGSLTFESKHWSKTGRVLDTEVTVNYLQYEGKEYNCAIMRDIGERKRAEEALRLAKFSMDRAADAVYWIDARAKVLDANEAASRMLGYSNEELCAMTVHDLNPDFQADMWPGFWAETQRRGTMVIETAHRAKNGRLIPIEVSVNHLSYEGKEYHCAFVRDITERKQADASLRQSEERYRSLVDNAPIGIFVNEEGRFAYVNREMQRILHATSAEQLIGTTVLDRIAPEFHQVVKDRIRTLMDNRQPVPSLDEQYVRLDGSRVDVAVTAIPTSFGDMPMMQVLVLDIAERKRVEEALRQRERELRTALEERERISQDLHDGILQSLFAVGLTLEASKSMMSPKARKTSGAPLDQAIDQLNRVMREIRNFIAGLGSDLLQGKDLPTALQHMLESLTQNQPTRVRLAVEDRAAKAVSVEQSLHLLLVIQEAVSNCIRHGHAQEARVSLKMLKQGVRLSIRDNGRGFNQNTAKGTGHGLSNMAARAQKIGGQFTVLSKINEGTRIVLDLPREASYARR